MRFGCVKANCINLFATKLPAPRTEEELQSQTFTWLRLPMVLLVLLIHVNPQNREIFTPISTIDFSCLSWANIYSILGRFGYYASLVAVPFFFFTSGYFFFHNVTEWNIQVYAKKLKKRFLTLVVPYVLWNMLSVSLVFISKGASVLLLGKPLDSLIEYVNSFPWWKILWNYSVWNEGSYNVLGLSTQMTGPFLLPLWFLRDLIVISFVLTPFIYYGVKYLKKYFILVLGVLYLVNICTLPGIAITGIFFFAFGAYISIQNKNAVTFFKRGRALYLLIAVICLAVCVAFDSTLTASLSQQVYCIAALASVILITSGYLSKGFFNVRPQLA